MRVLYDDFKIKEKVQVDNVSKGQCFKKQTLQPRVESLAY